MHDDLSKLSAAEIDSLPFGYIALAPDGTVRKYNRYEADLARKDPKDVLGRNFFKEVAPCTQVKEFEGRFKDFLAGDEMALTFDFDFKFRHGTQAVHIGFVRSPLDREVIVTVNRVADLSLPETAEMQVDASRGRLADGAGGTVVATTADFWSSLPVALAATGEGGGEEPVQRAHVLGRTWARQFLQRLESRVQDDHGKTLRETQIQAALEILSGALGLLGLGRFEVDFAFREEGLLRIVHHDSPFPDMLEDKEEAACGVLAGFHAGLMSHLSGRELVGREVLCGRSGTDPCVFVVGIEDRLRRLLGQGEDQPEAWLLGRLSHPDATGETEAQ